MNLFKNTREARSHLGAMDGGWSRDTMFIARMSLMVCEQLEELIALKEREVKSVRQPKRPFTPWQRFFAAQVKAGKTAGQAAELWRSGRKKAL